MKSLDRFGTPLRQVDAEICLEFEGHRSLTTAADIRQLQNGAIIFGVMSARPELYETELKRITGITTGGRGICSKGQVLFTRRELSIGDAGSLVSAEGLVQMIDIGAPFPSSSLHRSSPTCSLAIHNLLTLSAGRTNKHQTPTPLIKMRHFGIEAELSPLASYIDAARALEAGSQYQETFDLSLRSLRSGKRPADSWFDLADRICCFLSLQNLSSVWVSKMTMTSGTREWDRWISWASSPFTMHAKYFWDGLVRLEDALKLGLSQGAKRAIGEWGNLISYFSDAVSVSRYMETRALAAATLLDAVMNAYATTTNTSKYLTQSQEHKLRKLLKATVNDWHSEAASVGDDTLTDIKSNLAGVGRVPFKRRLQTAVSELKLPSGVPIDEIVPTRNALVHTGKFPDKVATDVKQQRRAYKSLMWVSVCLLFRLVGFKGDFRDFGNSIVP